MKNKKLLATVLLPLGLMQTFAGWFAAKDTVGPIIELLQTDKIPEQRRSGFRDNKNT
jgi:hypothetical protein